MSKRRTGQAREVEPLVKSRSPCADLGGGRACFAREASSPLSPLAGRGAVFQRFARHHVDPPHLDASRRAAIVASVRPKRRNRSGRPAMSALSAGSELALPASKRRCRAEQPLGHDTPVGTGPSPEFAVKLFEEHLEGHAGGSPHERLGVVEKDPRLGGTGMDQ